MGYGVWRRLGRLEYIEIIRGFWMGNKGDKGIRG
jgi:hypothetical protein